MCLLVVASAWRRPQEFLLFVLPLVNVRGWRARLGRWYRQVARPSGGGSDAPGNVPAKTTSACGVCGLDPMVLPYRTEPCQHVLCYVCLSTAQLADGSAVCPICGASVVRQHRIAPIRGAEAL